MSASTIVILRGADESAELADAVKEHGYAPFFEPVLFVEPVESANFSPPQAGMPLIFTSANAVRFFASLYEGRDHEVFTVGDNTADVAKGVGFTKIQSASGTADDLVELCLQTGLKQFLYVRGEQISRDLKEILAPKGVKLDEIIVYQAKIAENLSVNLLKMLDKHEIKAVMVFSARGAKAFSDLIEQYGRTLRMKELSALCIGQGVVDSLSVLPFKEVVVAPQPDRYGMMTLLDRLT